MGQATPSATGLPLMLSSQASYVIVSGFRAALDLDTYPLSNFRPGCAERAKRGRGKASAHYAYWLFRLFSRHISRMQQCTVHAYIRVCVRYIRVCVCMYSTRVYVYACTVHASTCMHVLNERLEGRKKEASKVKQTNKAKQHSTPKAVTFPRKMSCLRWDSNPRHSIL